MLHCQSPGIYCLVFDLQKTSKSHRCGWFRKKKKKKLKNQGCRMPDMGVRKLKIHPLPTQRNWEKSVGDIHQSWLLFKLLGQVWRSHDLQQPVLHSAWSGKLSLQVCADITAVQVIRACSHRMRFGWVFPLFFNSNPFSALVLLQKKAVWICNYLSLNQNYFGTEHTETLQLPLGINQLQEVFSETVIQALASGVQPH